MIANTNKLDRRLQDYERERVVFPVQLPHPVSLLILPVLWFLPNLRKTPPGSSSVSLNPCSWGGVGKLPKKERDACGTDNAFTADSLVTLSFLVQTRFGVPRHGGEFWWVAPYIHVNLIVLQWIFLSTSQARHTLNVMVDSSADVSFLEDLAQSFGIQLVVLPIPLRHSLLDGSPLWEVIHKLAPVKTTFINHTVEECFCLFLVAPTHCAGTSFASTTQLHY